MRAQFKFLAVFVGCLLLRLLPFRAPNLEPIMASVMPVGKKYGILGGFIFASTSMVLYDFITGHVGLWTWVTALVYGVIGAGSAIYFEKFKASTRNFVLFAIVGTIFFDVVTGILIAPFFGQSMASATIMQVPFTALHLAGNIGFALTLSPLISLWLSREKVSAFSWRRRIAV